MKPGDVFIPWKLFCGLFIPNTLARYTGISAAAKLLFGRMSQYAGKDGDCHPKQESLAAEIGVSGRYIRKLLKELEDDGFIRVRPPEGKDRLTHRSSRYDFLWHSIFDAPLDSEKSGPERTIVPVRRVDTVPLVYKVLKENHKKENHRTKAARTKTTFVPPSLAEIQSYCLERKNSIDAQQFMDYYASNGWRVGRNPMKDWRAAVRTWERREPAARTGGNARQQRPGDLCVDLGKYAGVPMEELS